MTTWPNKYNDQHFLFLDGMRGVAALLVAVLHSFQILTAGRFDLPNAHLAVDFFFCLSGFVIAYAYADRLGSNGMATAEFLRRRLIRLGPVLIAGLMLGALVYIAGATRGNQARLSQALFVSLLSLFLIPAGFLVGKEAYPINNPVWSLFFELVANVVYGFVTIKSRIVSLAVTAMLALLLIATASHFHSVGKLGFVTWQSFLGGFTRVGFPFVAGTMIYRFGLYSKGTVFWGAVAFLALPTVLLCPVGTWESDLVIITIVIPLIVIAGTAKANARVAPLLRLLGELSYPLYLIHQPILRAIRNVRPIENLSASHPAIVIISSLTIAACCSLCLSRFCDIPIRRHLTNLSLSRRQSLANGKETELQVRADLPQRP